MAEIVNLVVMSVLLGAVLSFAASQAFQFVLETQPPQSEWGRAGLMMMFLVAGPHVMVLAAHRCFTAGQWPASFVLGSYAVAATWCGALGFCLYVIV